MDLSSILTLGQTALELGFICSLVALALHLSYSMLNVCDLSTDGCLTLGAVVGAVVVKAGHPYLSIVAAMLAGVLSGLVTAILQTKMGVDSLLAGIIVNTALYSVNIGIMGGAPLVNLNKTDTVFTKFRDVLENTPLAGSYKLILAAVTVILCLTLLTLFLKTKLGISIRCTGDNPDMVRSSSINITVTTIIGLCISGSLTALSGCLMAQYQKSAEINIGTGMLTIALASLLIGRTVISKNAGLLLRGAGVIIGSVIFRLIYTVALRFDMPAFMLKAVSSVIVVLAISLPYFKSQKDIILRKFRSMGKGGKSKC